MQELKPRREMDPAFQWDLTQLFKTPDAWREAYAEAEKMIDALPRLAGTLGKSAASLEAALSEIGKLFCRGIYQRCQGRINIAHSLLSSIYVFRVKTNNHNPILYGQNNLNRSIKASRPL